jgi:hypothetical protein
MESRLKRVKWFKGVVVSINRDPPSSRSRGPDSPWVPTNGLFVAISTKAQDGIDQSYCSPLIVFCTT